MHTPQPYQSHLSSFIGSKIASNLLFTACHRVKEENKTKTSIILEEESEVDVNKAYLYSFFKFENSNLDVDSLSSFSKDNNND